MSKKLEQIKKQNEGMYNGLMKNKVSFERKSPPETDDDQILSKFYLEEQDELKKSLIEFRKSQPKPEPKPKKAAPPPKKKEEDEVLVEKRPNYRTIANMENIKRAFFNDEFDDFFKLAKEQGYHFYEAVYKYCEDMNGKPEFIAKNLLNGFVANLDNNRKYFMNCFRCFKDGDNYTYPSLWIVNTDADLKEVTEEFSEDFKFTKIENENADQFLERFKKMQDDDNLVNEKYLH